jgi:hypothetical protein
MSLRQLSIRDFFPTLAQKFRCSGRGKFRGRNLADSNVDSNTRRGAFLFGPPDQPANTTSTSMDATFHIQSQKRKEDTHDSEEETEVKRVRISKPDDLNTMVDAADEAVYEPQPKRLKLTHSTELYTGNFAVFEDEGFADDEAESTGSEDEGPTVIAPSTTNLLNAVTAIDTESEDESFVPDTTDRTVAEDENWSADDDDISTLTFASSATIQPISPITPPARSTSYPTNVTNSFQHAHTQQRVVGSIASTSISMRELNSSLPWLPPTPKARRRRQPASFVIYEDETATPPMSFDNDIEDEGRMPAVRHSVLGPLDPGQENRQPVVPAVEAPAEMPIPFLREDGGSDEEMVERENEMDE